jgi:hypothetical protein
MTKSARKPRLKLGVAPVALAMAQLALFSTQPAAAQTQGPAPECAAGPPHRPLCPDLVMRRPSGLYVDRQTEPGRVLLRATNWIENRGKGPLEFHGRRAGRRTMSARQAIHYRHAKTRLLPARARLYFYPIPGQFRYWKFRDAARFELWSIDRHGQPRKLVRVGPKTFYCFRDLRRSFPSGRSPRHWHFPGCSQNANARRVTLGTSVGWADIYPATYHEQWIDVTGLRGRFIYRQIIDPRNHVAESNEGNNVADLMVRLPYPRTTPTPSPLSGPIPPGAPGSFPYSSSFRVPPLG